MSTATQLATLRERALAAHAAREARLEAERLGRIAAHERSVREHVTNRVQVCFGISLDPAKIVITEEGYRGCLVATVMIDGIAFTFRGSAVRHWGFSDYDPQMHMTHRCEGCGRVRQYLVDSLEQLGAILAEETSCCSEQHDEEPAWSPPPMAGRDPYADEDAITADEFARYVGADDPGWDVENEA
jgi:hypothetical protein